MAAEELMLRLQEQVEDARERCSKVVGALNTVRLRLQEHGGDAAVRSARIHQALEALREASSHLASAMFLMGACSELALRAGPHLSSEELSSIDDFPGVANLHDARAIAQNAHVALDHCHDNLLVASFLLDHHGILGMDASIEAKLASATGVLGYANGLAVDCEKMARGAHDKVSEYIN